MHLQEQVSRLEATQSNSAEAREQAIAEAERAAAMARKHAAATKAAKAKTWAEEEVRMLEKALTKFPQVPLPSHLKGNGNVRVNAEDSPLILLLKTE